MSSSDPAKAFAALLKRLRGKYEGAAPVIPDDPVAHGASLMEQLIYSFMLWEASSVQAKQAARKLSESFADLNELRVAFPHETAGVLGERYPLAVERCLRLRCVLQELYQREHVMSMVSLIAAGKREARQYLESMQGMPAFVAARMLALGLGGHAVPADYRLMELLSGEKAMPEDVDSPGEASAWLERQVRASEAGVVASVLQGWSDEKGTSPKFDRSFASAALTVPVGVSVTGPAKTKRQSPRPKMGRRGATKGRGK